MQSRLSVVLVFVSGCGLLQPPASPDPSNTDTTTDATGSTGANINSDTGSTGANTGATGSTSSTGTTGATGCTGTDIACTGGCVNSTVSGNCGVCGVTCGGTSVCDDPNGTFTCTCPTGENYCNNDCHAENDPTHCGASCTACGVGTSCQGSPGNYACVSVCTGPNEIFCGGNCVDKTLSGNCGGCGVTCQGTSTCDNPNGPYQCTCAAGENFCTDDCYAEDDPNHCGGCTACTGGDTCQGTSGNYACAPVGPTGCTGPNEIDCGGNCVDSSLSGNCGACNVTCLGSSSCEDPLGTFACTCSPGENYCTDDCYAEDDPNHCGGCTACTGGDTCQGTPGNYACAPVGPPGCSGPNEIECTGNCVDSSVNGNCGACDVTCPGTSVCDDPLGTFTCTCGPGFNLCTNDCEVEDDPTHCGSACADCGALSCIDDGAGDFHCACPPGESFCDGACVATTDNDLHCGGCGACPGVTGPTGGLGCNGTVCVARDAGPSAPTTTTEQPYGHTDGVIFTFTGTPGDAFECRSILKNAADTVPYDEAWTSCDGTMAGTGMTHSPFWSVDGTHVTQVRTARNGSVPASTLSTSADYYVHSSLTGVAGCVAASGWTKTAADFLAAAPTHFANIIIDCDASCSSGQNYENYPIAPSGLQDIGEPFDESADVTPPFVSIPFNFVMPSMQYAFFSPFSPFTLASHDDLLLKPSATHYNRSFDFTIDSATQIDTGVATNGAFKAYFAPLRHRFVFNASRTLLYVERSRPSRLGDNGCTMPLDLMDVITVGTTRTTPFFTPRDVACRAMIVRSDGTGFCYTADDPSGPRHYSRYMWRKVFKTQHTSPKCFSEGCGLSTHQLYLPE